MEALGTIETVGLAAAFEAADVACKTANVELIGYELAKGGGFVTIKVVGKVAAVNSAIAAAKAAAEKVNRVVATLVIPRPASQIEPLIRNAATRGYRAEPRPSKRSQSPPPMSSKPLRCLPATSRHLLAGPPARRRHRRPRKPSRCLMLAPSPLPNRRPTTTSPPKSP